VTTHDSDTEWLPCHEPGYDTLFSDREARDFNGLLGTLGFMAARYSHTQGFHASQLTHSAPQYSPIDILSRFTKLMLMVTELAEVAEALRTQTNIPADAHTHTQSTVIPEFTQEEEELADTFIRLLDYAGTYRIRLGHATLAKMQYNRTREHMHGKKV
jgi:NTP pyrophosphatase (non-canonical NTP hydrolase)